jgi:hypothetical protein
MLRRHREHLTGLVEALQDRAAGIPPERDGPVVGVLVHNLVSSEALAHLLSLR